MFRSENSRTDLLERKNDMKSEEARAISFSEMSSKSSFLKLICVIDLLYNLKNNNE